MKALRAELKRQNAAYPWHLVEVPVEQWPKATPMGLFRVFRSRDFLVQCYLVSEGVIRLSINRAALNAGSSRWSDGISWADMQRLKQRAGYGDRDAVEVFPRDADVVNVANLRHLFVFTGDCPLTFVWRKAGGAA